MIISAPLRDVVALSDISREAELTIDGVPVDRSENGGVAYLFTHTQLWSSSGLESLPLPKPHMYQCGGGGDNGGNSDIVFLRPTIDPTPGGLRIGGRPDENIQNIIGIPDFNSDSRADYVVGAPLARAGDGAAYVVFRRANSLEGDYVLDKLTLDPGDQVRLAGIHLTGNVGEAAQLGTSLAGGNERTDTLFDFNGDEVEDVLIGSPSGNAGTGEIVILFAASQFTSPEDGIDVDTLLAQGQGALITGVDGDSQFGFNIANAGDIDGDDTDELLIAAPGATPKFDSNPNDDIDQLDANGVDRDLDGIADDVTGPFGVPDGIVDQFDELTGAGLVYVIFGSADARGWAAGPGLPMVISIDRLGTAELPGFIIAGRRSNDQLGGGNAATDPVQGNPSKAAGRSKGLAGVGDVDNDGKADIIVGSVLADPRIDPQTGVGIVNGGESYLIYGFSQND